MRRRLLATLFLAAFLSATLWLLVQATRPEVLPLGAEMPRLVYRDSTGVHRLAPPAHGNATVIFFHSDCEFCRLEFNALDHGLDQLPDTHFFLITLEDPLPLDTLRARWPRLAASTQVNWGSVDAEEYRQGFGILATPAIFVFDGYGALANKYRGLTQLAALAPAARGGAEENR